MRLSKDQHRGIAVASLTAVVTALSTVSGYVEGPEARASMVVLLSALGLLSGLFAVGPSSANALATNAVKKKA
jgi:hypothetical protein